MNKSKYLIIVILVICSLQMIFSEKRTKPVPIKELTDPNSHNYVPYPHPGNEKELLEDMKYAIKKIYIKKEGRNYITKGNPPKSHKILPNLLEEKSIYKIGKIFKIKNLLSGSPYEYRWMINILNKDETIAAKVMMTADGLWGGTSSGFIQKLYLKTDDEIIIELSGILNRDVKTTDISHIQAIELPPHIGTIFNPAYEIKLKNEEVYYYKPYSNEFYQISREIPWKKNKDGHRPDFEDIDYKTEKFSFDQINDKVIVFKKLE